VLPAPGFADLRPVLRTAADRDRVGDASALFPAGWDWLAS
jgi:hypothetical protein